jgi:RNA polymerase sigma factor (sigma-70 family)
MIDLIEIGNEGLIVAAKEFRSSKGFKFSTFAGNCITNEFNSRLLRRPYDLTILDVPYYTDKVSGESCKDRIIDEATIMPLENIAINEVSEIIKKMLDEKLKDKERKVIQLLFGIYDGVPQTPTEISKMMGVSRQRISIIKEEALAKLKIPAKNAGLEDQFS